VARCGSCSVSCEAKFRFISSEMRTFKHISTSYETWKTHPLREKLPIITTSDVSMCLSLIGTQHETMGESTTSTRDNSIDYFATGCAPLSRLLLQTCQFMTCTAFHFLIQASHHISLISRSFQHAYIIRTLPYHHSRLSAPFETSPIPSGKTDRRQLDNRGTVIQRWIVH
jgi:hypothetical protein